MWAGTQGNDLHTVDQCRRQPATTTTGTSGKTFEFCLQFQRSEGIAGLTICLIGLSLLEPVQVSAELGESRPKATERVVAQSTIWFWFHPSVARCQTAVNNVSLRGSVLSYWIARTGLSWLRWPRAARSFPLAREAPHSANDQLSRTLPAVHWTHPGCCLVPWHIPKSPIRVMGSQADLKGARP